MKSFTTATVSTLALLTTTYACSVVENNAVTFYGFPDNDPASAQTAYSCGGRNNIAGGTGTYADPVTFATAPGEFNQCEIIYLPLLKKYLRMEDSCAQCTTDFKSGKKHIDIWTGSNKVSGGQTQIDCEDKLTSGGNYQVVRQPPQGLEVDSTPLFDNGKCNTDHVFESNKASCVAGSGSADSSGAAPSGAPTTLVSSTKSHSKGHGKGQATSKADSQASATQSSPAAQTSGSADDEDCEDEGDSSSSSGQATPAAYGSGSPASATQKNQAQQTGQSGEDDCDDE